MGVGSGLYMYDVVVKKFTFAISSPNEFVLLYREVELYLSVIFMLSIWTDSRTKQLRRSLGMEWIANET